jgi:hypothetical protein
MHDFIIVSLHLCYNYSLIMDESKSETNVNHGVWAVIYYMFHIMYGKIVFDVMDNESV